MICPKVRCDRVLQLMNERNYTMVSHEFIADGNYCDAKTHFGLFPQTWQSASGRWVSLGVLSAYQKAGNHQDPTAKQRSLMIILPGQIASVDYHTAGLKVDGAIVTEGNNL